jgi:hypothetical protein
MRYPLRIYKCLLNYTLKTETCRILKKELKALLSEIVKQSSVFCAEKFLSRHIPCHLVRIQISYKVEVIQPNSSSRKIGEYPVENLYEIATMEGA